MFLIKSSNGKIIRTISEKNENYFGDVSWPTSGRYPYLIAVGGE